ncbi:type ISP restriction/modification enzyme [Streptomyces sp. NBC_01257]|uniref:type ISP restriction/modification enzyme n=1 Tax=Streptomyces sp. NBC_01257 TaxID=2903799 RepID=UPI003FA3A105
MPRLPSDRPRCAVEMPDTEEGMPQTLRYEPDEQRLWIGSGCIAPVRLSTREYQVSRMNVPDKWFNYRRKEPAGKRRLELDHVVARRWPPDWTSELLSVQHPWLVGPGGTGSTRRAGSCLCRLSALRTGPGGGRRYPGARTRTQARRSRLWMRDEARAMTARGGPWAWACPGAAVQLSDEWTSAVVAPPWAMAAKGDEPKVRGCAARRVVDCALAGSPSEEEPLGHREQDLLPVLSQTISGNHSGA